jgi:hypothetical protein
MASTYLSKTLGTATSSRIWTFSTWLKRSGLSSTQHIFSIDNGSARDAFSFDSDNGLRFYLNNSATGYADLSTNRVLRDTFAFYHLVIAVDTTQSTAANRIKLYINGTQYTWDETTVYGDQNYDTFNASGNTFRIGRDRTAANYFDGILTHTYFTDGYAYDASTFGQTDATTGIWKPKGFSGSYGTNGFFLKFENSGSMGLDSSGNANNFTVNGTLTQTVDTPSNVFATLNALTKTNASMIFTNGNTTCTATGNWIGNMATLGATKGKWYAEAKITDPLNFSIGFTKFGGTFQNNMNTVNSGYLGIGNDSWGFWGNGPSANLYHNSTQTSYGSVTSTNDIMMLAMDLDNGNLYWGKNGTWFNSSNPATSTSPAFSGINIDEYITFGTGVENGSVQWNFGNGYFGTTAVSSATTDESGLGIFEYTVPSGYYALCTKNINEQEYD